ncbi:MAG: GPW/gp25 family protein [Cyanobacteria bacterium J06621_11]
MSSNDSFVSDSFLGTGWNFPPTFEQATGQTLMVTDEEDIAQSLDIILSTSLNERIFRPDFGCDLSQFLFEAVDQGLLTRLKGIVSDALLYYESRIKVVQITILEDSAEPGLLSIHIDYTIRQTNATYNRVYPFYLKEAA